MGKNKNRLVVASKGWGETIPEWLKKEVEKERLIYSFASLVQGGKTRVGDAEVLVYLYTLSLTQGLTHEFTSIYFYLCTKLLKEKGKEVPEDLQKESLDAYEKELLENLRDEIYQKRGKEISHPLLEALKRLKKGENKHGRREGEENNIT